MINQVRRTPVKVSIKSFDVRMDVKNKGVEFQIPPVPIIGETTFRVRLV